MIYESDISELLTQWEARLKDSEKDSFQYWVALSECIHDLKDLVDRTHKEESQDRDLMEAYYASIPVEELKNLTDSWDADSYLASFEAQEHALLNN